MRAVAKGRVFVRVAQGIARLYEGMGLIQGVTRLSDERMCRRVQAAGLRFREHSVCSTLILGAPRVSPQHRPLCMGCVSPSVAAAYRTWTRPPQRVIASVFCFDEARFLPPAHPIHLRPYLLADPPDPLFKHAIPHVLAPRPTSLPR